MSKFKTIIGGAGEPEGTRPFPPELIEWAIALYHQPKMLHIEVSKTFFRAVKANPEGLKMTAVGKNGVEVIERPHRHRMPGEEKLGTVGYDTFEVLRKD